MKLYKSDNINIIEERDVDVFVLENGVILIFKLNFPSIYIFF